MSSVRTRRTAAASLTLVAALGLSACGTGFDTAVNQQYQAAVGADNREGEVEALHTLVVADEGSLEPVEVSEAEGEEQETEAPEREAAEAGVVAVSLVNNGEDDAVLTGITAGEVDGEQVEVTGPSRVRVPKGQLVRLGVDARTLFAVSPIAAGRYVELTFSFADGTTVVVDTPTVARGDQDVYESVLQSTDGRQPADRDATGNAEDADSEETTARPE
ncbi:hypothetical protein [Aeromicrobium massiliense]|uniref:hypothetical protein n=1 Tax=Aeromicrobium massiliense TaxID=1464554 RepID=UPI0002D3858A|nr:hypothetical protein [Aeromicrobium massiliense]